MINDGSRKATISNVGASILKLLDVVHLTAKTLVDMARAQDAEVGDGTTTVTTLAKEFLKLARPYLEDGVHPKVFVHSSRIAERMSLRKVEELPCHIKKVVPSEQRQMLEKCAAARCGPQGFLRQTRRGCS
ncbi:T-complex protein 1 subunit eta [Fasciola hepatica]|uniref:T-complex protein 1 subunit eta n=1 Tax=Fasciola hepatica TaxID=6192 RepID=A0A4E0RBG9_FASHE|nr:T-complex protein 1 subunit eta [Fasciola hepatica]